MSSLKCPTCGHRIPLSATMILCANCGAPLPPEVFNQEPLTPLPTHRNSPIPTPGATDNGEPSSLSPRQQRAANKRTRDGMPDMTIEQLPPSAAAQQEQGGETHPHAAEPSHYSTTAPDLPTMRQQQPAPLRSLVLREDAALVDQRGGQGKPPTSDPALPVRYAPSDLPSPYAISGPPYIASNGEYLVDYNGQTRVAALPYSTPPNTPLHTKYPFWFPRRPPEIQGTIVNVQASSENISLTSPVFKGFRDAVWVTPNDPSASVRHDQLLVTTLRIREANGMQKDARLEGYLIGGHLTLGDTISLWGRKRRGMLIVRRAFNNTSGAIIAARLNRHSTWPTVVLILFLLIAYLVLALWYHFPILPDLSPWLPH